MVSGYVVLGISGPVEPMTGEETNTQPLSSLLPTSVIIFRHENSSVILTAVVEILTAATHSTAALNRPNDPRAVFSSTLSGSNMKLTAVRGRKITTSSPRAPGFQTNSTQSAIFPFIYFSVMRSSLFRGVPRFPPADLSRWSLSGPAV